MGHIISPRILGRQMWKHRAKIVTHKDWQIIELTGLKGDFHDPT